MIRVPSTMNGGVDTLEAECFPSAKRVRLGSSNCEEASRDFTEAILELLFLPTPPPTPADEANIDSLEDKTIVRIMAQPALSVIQRFELRLVCHRWKRLVEKSWGRVRYIRMANVESWDERISSPLVLNVLWTCLSVTTVTLCLSSNINYRLCSSNELFQVLSHCVNLRSLSLLLTQLGVYWLNTGLDVLGRGLRKGKGSGLHKLSLAYCHVDAMTMHNIALHFGDLRSLGFPSSISISDGLLRPLLLNCSQLRTLCLNYCPKVTEQTASLFLENARLYCQIPHSPTSPGKISLEHKAKAASHKNKTVKLYVRGSCVNLVNLPQVQEDWVRLDTEMGAKSIDLEDDAPRQQWEYDSEDDFC